MKTTIGVLWLLIASGLAASAESYRTDINPALLYWQAAVGWPSLSEEDHAYLFKNEWRGRPLEDKFIRLIAEYDYPIKLVRRAARSQVKCDWGYDLSDGPELMLYGLAKAKSAAQVVRLRALWHLQQGNQAEAADELVSALVLGRNLSTDGILISALVQFAVENIITAAVAENFYRFDAETLKQIANGIAAAPLRGTIAQCVPAERYSFAGWLLRNLESFKANSANDEMVVRQMRDLMQKSFSSGEGSDPTLADRIIKAAGGTAAGLMKYINGVNPLYDEAEALLVLPHAEFMERIARFNQKVHSHPNLLVSIFFPVFENCRGKEYAAQVTLAMLQAGIEYRLTGEGALKLIQDPVFKQPFGFSRVVINGVDRGFRLHSPLKTRGFEETVIFVEKEGPAFHVIGKNAP